MYLDFQPFLIAGLSLYPLSTIGLLTPFLIGSYLKKLMFTCVANYDKALEMLHAQTYETYFFSHPL